ncbi:MAG: patatin-like phospholipase family protein, partial [Candidatus Limnocylindrales bacterium]
MNAVAVEAPPNPDVALVLSGGGARGAYEAGALSALLPYLTKRGERPGIILGTSIGALNSGHMAATSNLPIREALDGLVSLWGRVQLSDILGPLLSPTTLLRLAQYAGGLVGIPQARVPSLLDTGPLPALLNELIDFNQLHANIDRELVALAVIATSYSTGESVVFHEGPIGVAVEQDVKRG